MPRGPINARHISPNRGPARLTLAERRSRGNDSGVSVTSKTRVTAERPAAMKKGREREMVAAQPPTPGPSTMPIPMAAPMSPMPPPRSRSDVLSAT